MIKKLTLLAMAVGALIAFAVPAMASAEVLEDESGTLNPGDIVVATSSNVETTTSSGTLSCAGGVHLLLEVLTNENPAEVEGNGSASECSITQNGAPVVITSISVGNITVGGGVGTGDFQFVSDIAGVLTCTFTGTNIPITYSLFTDEVHLEGGLTATGTKGCPETGTIAGDFTLETEDTTPVFLNG